MSDPKSIGPIAGSIKQEIDRILNEPPVEEGGVAEVTVTRDGVEGEVTTSIGRGWSTGVWGAWMREKGWAFAGKLTGRWGQKKSRRSA